MDVIGVPRVRTDQPVMPPVRSSGDTIRKVGVKGLIYLDESCPREFSNRGCQVDRRGRHRSGSWFSSRSALWPPHHGVG
ncbi:hypothetical protein CN079_28845 [Sinorhizobium medicae]|nr:hypothetical protein CN079_28845 [Sinorhizobium medicae]